MGLSNRDKSGPGPSSEARSVRESSAGHDGAGSHPVEPGSPNGGSRLGARLVAETERYMASLLALYRWEEEREGRGAVDEDPR
ncbi:hypothetical protein [Aeromonas sp. AE23HZ002T15]